MRDQIPNIHLTVICQCHITELSAAPMFAIYFAIARNAVRGVRSRIDVLYENTFYPAEAVSFRYFCNFAQ